MQKHKQLCIRAIYFSQHKTLSQECSSALKHLLTFKDFEYHSDNYSQCIQIIQNKCSDMFFFPSLPIIFTDIYFAYMKNDFQIGTSVVNTPFYVCFSQSRYNFSNFTTIIFNNTACFDAKIILRYSFEYRLVIDLYIASIVELYKAFQKYHLIYNYTTEICNRSSMYQCLHSSKCISLSRLMDTYYDCPYMDDENFTQINSEKVIKQLNKTHFKCPKTGRYIHPSLVENNDCDCSIDSRLCEDGYLNITYLNTHIVFQPICDGFVDKSPELINDRNETDETECEQWKCNNTYTRCNNVWNCPNGADETGCKSYSTLNCSSKEHFCVRLDTYEFTCLSIEKANDGNIDYLGASDESKMCARGFQKERQDIQFVDDFYCKIDNNHVCISLDSLCNNYSSCDQGEDERFCTNITIKNRCSSFMPWPRLLFHMDYSCPLPFREIKTNRTDAEKFLLNHKVHDRLWKPIDFILDEPVQSNMNELETTKPTIPSSSSVIERLVQHVPHCHRGLNLRV